MPKEKSLFERLDDISVNQTELLNEIVGVTNKVDNTNTHIANLEKQIQNLQIKQAQSPSVNRIQPGEPPLKTFARYAKKSWRWFGNPREFNRAKSAAIFISLLMILFGIISTIITGVSYGIYSPFSGIENIWLVFAIIYLIFACKSPLKFEVNAFARGTSLRVEKDDVGMVFPIGKEKLVFRVFRWITLIMVVFNIALVWVYPSNTSWLATIFELLFAISVIVAFFINGNLFAQYSICYLEGKNLVNGQSITLVRMPGSNSFDLEKDIREKIPQLFK